VLIAGCRLGECHYHNGNYQALQRVNVLKGVLDKIGLDPGRVKIVWCAASEGEIFAKDLKEFIGELKALGPIGTELKTERMEQKETQSEDNTTRPTKTEMKRETSKSGATVP
jgi:heterodisulfide reductase subunit A